MRFSILIPLFLSAAPFTAADWWLKAYTGANCGGQEVGSWAAADRHPQCEKLDFLVPILSVRGDAGADGVLQVYNKECGNTNWESWYIRNECVNAGSWGEWKAFRVRLNLSTLALTMHTSRRQCEQKLIDYLAADFLLNGYRFLF
jgi:hypothetical protein